MGIGFAAVSWEELGSWRSWWRCSLSFLFLLWVVSSCGLLGESSSWCFSIFSPSICSLLITSATFRPKSVRSFLLIFLGMETGKPLILEREMEPWRLVLLASIRKRWLRE